MYDPYAELTKQVLPNGLEVHSVFWDRPWISVEIVVHSGGREDPVTQLGLAHFVEHLVSSNIYNWKTDQVREFFEINGGQVNLGSTSYLATRYKFSLPADLTTFRQALAIFGSMLLRARLEKGLEHEREVIHREYNQIYPYPKKLEWDMSARQALFKGHRLEKWNRPLGRPEGFLSVMKADLQGFYDRYYVPANISLVVVGGLPTGDIINELEKSPFGMRKNGERNKIPPTFDHILLPLEQEKTVRFSDYTNLKFGQMSFAMTWAFPADFPKQARCVFSRILDNILFDEIREKRGLAYSISTNYTNFQDVGEYGIGGKVNPSATFRIAELVRQCLSMVVSRRDLFDRMLKTSLQRCLMTDLSGSGLADNSAHDLVYNQRIILMQEVWDDLQKVTFEQMVKVCSLLSSERQYTFIACP